MPNNTFTFSTFSDSVRCCADYDFEIFGLQCAVAPDPYEFRKYLDVRVAHDSVASVEFHRERKGFKLELIFPFKYGPGLDACVHLQNKILNICESEYELRATSSVKPGEDSKVFLRGNLDGTSTSAEIANFHHQNFVVDDADFSSFNQSDWEE